MGEYLIIACKNCGISFVNQWVEELEKELVVTVDEGCNKCSMKEACGDCEEVDASYQDGYDNGYADGIKEE